MQELLLVKRTKTVLTAYVVLVALVTVQIISNHPSRLRKQQQQQQQQKSAITDVSTTTTRKLDLTTSVAAASSRQRQQQKQQQKQQNQQQQLLEDWESPPSNVNYSSVELDWSDPIFRRVGWDVDPIVIERYNLLFFTIPKVACTTFKMLFRRIEGKKDWAKADPHHPDWNGLRYLGRYPKHKQMEYMTSPNWTRAIFVRDPLVRTVSAYLDKGVGYHTRQDGGGVEGDYIKRKCCDIKPRTTDTARNLELEQLLRRQNDKSSSAWRKGGVGVGGHHGILGKMRISHPKCIDLAPYEKPTNETILPFETFVSAIIPTCPDGHWLPQSHRLRRKNWKYINFVGHFESVYDDAKRLLQHIGAWDEFGASGWGIDNNNNSGRNNNSKESTNVSIFEKNTATHKTSSWTYLDNYYGNNNRNDTIVGNDGGLKATLNVEELVVRYYQSDYEHDLFNFTKPMNYDKYIQTVAER